MNPQPPPEETDRNPIHPEAYSAETLTETQREAIRALSVRMADEFCTMFGWSKMPALPDYLEITIRAEFRKLLEGTGQERQGFQFAQRAYAECVEACAWMQEDPHLKPFIPAGYRLTTHGVKALKNQRDGLLATVNELTVRLNLAREELAAQAMREDLP